MTGEGAAALLRSLQVAVDGVRDGVWVLDSEGRTTWVNAALEELVGHPRSELLGTSLFDRLDLVDDGSPGAADGPQRYRLTRADGTHVWVGLTATTVTDADGRPSGAAIVVDSPVVPEPVEVSELQTVMAALLPNPRAAADDDVRALQRMSELAASGASLNTIAAALNADGIVAPRGRRWHASSVARALYRSR